MRQIIIRMDDICQTMDFDKFKRYKTLFDEYDVKPLIAVIPASKDDKTNRGFVPCFWEYIQSLISEGWEIAMHGLHHTYTSKERGLVTNRAKSEFSGVDLEEQIRMISQGREELRKHGVETDVFAAPGHSYDINTLKALKRNGFNYVSDGMSSHNYVLEGIKCIPADSAFRLNGYGILTICIHSNEDSDADFLWLKKFIEKNRDKIVPFSKVANMNNWPYAVCRIEEKIRISVRDNIGRISKIKNYGIKRKPTP